MPINTDSHKRLLEQFQADELDNIFLGDNWPRIDNGTSFFGLLVPGNISENLNKFFSWYKDRYDLWLVTKFYKLLKIEVLKPEVYIKAKLCFCLFAVKPKVTFQAFRICPKNFTYSFSLHEV